ncbi:hypothetical protein EDD18DRAFT_1345632 [Armillaria luteobubalina]|uniref:Uncharacterized protein n=1 Tax=Armillaria luteobubalina TaxID=153913 RepID=A0AA39QIS5_9AGAR|nr:hypothetical protein EDD18DRAFT_1345632 [Armillaria luteobubalina]
MAPSFDVTCPITKALHELQFCLDHKAESSDSSMHTAGWVRTAYVAWCHLDLAWQSEEGDFMYEEAWFGLSDQLWLLLAGLDMNLVGNSYKEFEYLAVEAEKTGFNVPSLPDLEEANTNSPVNPGASNSLVLPPVPTGDEPIPRSPTPAVSTAEGELPLFPLPPSHEPHGDSPPSGSEFELEGTLSFPASVRSMAFKSFPAPIPFTTPGVKFPSSPKRCCLDKDKKDKKNKKSKKVKETEPEVLSVTHKSPFILSFYLICKPAPSAPPPRKCGRPCKVRPEKPVFKRKGSLGEPIPPYTSKVVEPHLQPIGLLVPNKDFGDYMGCGGFYFTRPLGELVGHLMQEACDTCHRAGVQCHTICSKSTKCFHCSFMKHPCVVFCEDNHTNTVEQVFDPSTSLADAIQHDLQVILDQAILAINLESGSVKHSFLKQQARALHELSELIDEGMRLSREADDKDEDGEEESEVE